MRPRVFPAENFEAVMVTDAASVTFNEAAGIPRGKRPRRALMVALVLLQ